MMNDLHDDIDKALAALTEAIKARQGKECRVGLFICYYQPDEDGWCVLNGGNMNWLEKRGSLELIKEDLVESDE